MLAQIMQWLQPPQFADARQTQAARQLDLILKTIITAVTITMLSLTWVMPEGAVRWLAVCLVLDVVCLFFGALARSGRIRLASILLVLTFSAIVPAFAYSAGGVRAPITYGYIVVVFVAGLLLGPRAGVITALGGSLVGLGLVLAEEANLLAPRIFLHSNVSIWAGQTLILGIMVGLQYMTVNSIRKSLHSARQELAERQTAEAALRASEAKYRRVVETANEGIIVLDRDSRLTLVNQQAASMWGYSIEELLGQKMEMLVAEEHLDDHRVQMELRASGHNAVYERCFRRKDGERLWALVSATAITNDEGRFEGAFGMLTDITARKLAEQEREALLVQVTAARNDVSQARDRLDHIMERVSDGFVAFDKDFNYTYVNTFGGELLGRTPEDLVGKNYWIEYPEARGTPFANAYVRAMQTQQPVILEDFYVHWDRWFANRIYPSTEGLTIFFTDITERKRMEEETILKNKQLTMLNHLGRALNKLASLPEIVERISTLIGLVFDTRNLYIALYDETTQTVSFPIYWMDGEQKNSLESRPFSNGLTEYIIRTRAPVLIADRVLEVLAERGIDTVGAVSRCYLGVPIMIEKRVIGVIAIQDYERVNIYGANHTELLATIAYQAAIAIENARLYEAIRQELTERKRAEQALQENEARLRALVQTANDAVITMDARQNIVDWNRSAEMIFGYSAQEAIGMTVSQIVPERFRTHQIQAVRRALASKERNVVGKTVESSGLAKGQREFPIEMSLAEWQTQTGIFFTAFIRDISERKQRELEMQAIAALSAALRTAQTRAQILEVLVDTLGKLLHCDSMSAEIIDPLTGDTVIESAYGIWTVVLGFRQSSGTGLNAILSQTRRPYLDNNIRANPRLIVPERLMSGMIAGAGVPLIAQEHLIGFLWMGRSSEITESEARLFAAAADIAANAIHRATLHEQTQKFAADLAQAYDTTLEGWAHALELRDQDTEGHTRRVTEMTLGLARKMGVPGEHLENIRRGALLHDIGKMGIPDAVLLKPGALNDVEWEIMQRHPQYAYNLLQQIEYLRPALNIPYCHHEKWDGSGYPRKLKDEQIPLEARIFAVVDVWDALTNDRIYRRAWSTEETLRHIRLQSGKHFDPRVVESFLTR